LARASAHPSKHIGDLAGDTKPALMMIAFGFLGADGLLMSDGDESATDRKRANQKARKFFDNIWLSGDY
jgi:hypothetical protein